MTVSTLSLPTLDTAAKRGLAGLTSPSEVKAIALAGDHKAIAKATKDYASLYAGMAQVTGRARENMTYAGAYVTYLTDAEADDKRKVDGVAVGTVIANRLATVEDGEVKPLSSGRVSQLRTIARLIFDLDFGPDEEITRRLTAKTHKGFGKVVADAKSREDVERWWAAFTAEQNAAAHNREVGGSASESGTAGAGAEEDTREPRPNNGSGQPMTRGAMFAQVETLVAALGDPHDGAEWARLATIWAGIESVLDASEHKGDGQKVLAK